MSPVVVEKVGLEDFVGRVGMGGGPQIGYLYAAVQEELELILGN